MFCINKVSTARNVIKKNNYKKCTSKNICLPLFICCPFLTFISHLIVQWRQNKLHLNLPGIAFCVYALSN